MTFYISYFTFYLEAVYIICFVRSLSSRASFWAVLPFYCLCVRLWTLSSLNMWRHISATNVKFWFKTCHLWWNFLYLFSRSSVNFIRFKLQICRDLRVLLGLKDFATLSPFTPTSPPFTPTKLDLPKSIFFPIIADYFENHM